MKKILILAIFLFCVKIIFAQKLSFEILAGPSFPLANYPSGYLNDSSTEMSTGFHIGALIGFPANEKNMIETGLILEKSKLTNRSFSMGNSMELEVIKNLIWIPVYYRFNFSNNFFVKPGVITTLDLMKDDGLGNNLSGIGLGISGGILFRINDISGVSHSTISQHQPAYKI